MDGLPTSALSDIFETEPVPLATYLYDSKFLGLAKQKIELSPIQFDFIRHFEQVYNPETYIALVEQLGEEWMPVRMVNTIIGLYGKGGGKDLCCRLSISRVADLLLNLRSPQGYFGIPETDEIQMLNVAVSAPQAQTAFFRPMRNMLVKSPRFEGKFRSGNAPGDNAKSIPLTKNLELISGHSEAESQEGMNLIAAIADEIGAFKTESESKLSAGRVNAQTADYIIDMLRSSASTRFPKNYKLGLISYPRYEGDAIMRAVEEGRQDNVKNGDKSKFYVSGPYATWEVNPRVTKADFQEDYDRDPEFAQAKYECKPPKAADRFLRSDIAIYSGFHREEDPMIEVEYYWGVPNTTPHEHLDDPKPGWQVKFFISPDLIPMDGAIYALHGDIALRQDKAGIAMSHVSQYRESPYSNDQSATQPVVKVDFVTSFSADMAAEVDGEIQPREVKIDWYRQLVFELMSRGFTIGSVTFDGFQSAGLIQQMIEYGIESEVVSLDRNTSVYDNFKDVLYSGRLDAPRDAETIDELMKLTKVSHRKIDHLPNGSKDRADAVAGSVFGAIQCGGGEGESPEAVDLTWENSHNIDRGFTVDLSVHMDELGIDSPFLTADTPSLAHDYFL